MQFIRTRGHPAAMDHALRRLPPMARFRTRPGAQRAGTQSRGVQWVGLVGLLSLLGSVAAVAEPQGLLEGIRRHSIVTSAVPDNGDQNPYALVVAPVSAGKIQAGDVLIDNFNDKNNLQGLGTTIVRYTPTTKQLSLFAAIPRNLPQCPGGVGLTTAMTMLKSGWVI